MLHINALISPALDNCLSRSMRNIYQNLLIDLERQLSSAGEISALMCNIYQNLLIDTSNPIAVFLLIFYLPAKLFFHLYQEDFEFFLERSSYGIQKTFAYRFPCCLLPSGFDNQVLRLYTIFFHYIPH